MREGAIRFCRACCCAVVLACTLSLADAIAQEPRSHIPREQVEQMFAQMRADAPWDVDGPLLWGYFFTAGERETLEGASDVLVQDGYRFVDIRLEESASPADPDVWWLHVERVEQHTVDSLDQRNAEFDAFAREHHLAGYDGMDVGPAP